MKWFTDLTLRFGIGPELRMESIRSPVDPSRPISVEVKDDTEEATNRLNSRLRGELLQAMRSGYAFDFDPVIFVESINAQLAHTSWPPVRPLIGTYSVEADSTSSSSPIATNGDSDDEFVTYRLRYDIPPGTREKPSSTDPRTLGHQSAPHPHAMPRRYSAPLSGLEQGITRAPMRLARSLSTAISTSPARRALPPRPLPTPPIRTLVSTTQDAAPSPHPPL